MNTRRTRIVFAILLALYGLFILPAAFDPGYIDTTVGKFAAFPYISIYLFDWAGMPGLLKHGGGCGWGWCEPTLFGLAFVTVLWLGLAWLLAWGIAAVTKRL